MNAADLPALRALPGVGWAERRLGRGEREHGVHHFPVCNHEQVVGAGGQGPVLLVGGGFRRQNRDQRQLRHHRAGGGGLGA